MQVGLGKSVCPETENPETESPKAEKPVEKDDYQALTGEDRQDQAIRSVISKQILEEMTYNHQSYDLIPALYLDLIQVDKEEEETQVYLHGYCLFYSYENGIFSNDSGSTLTRRYDLDGGLQIKKIWQAEEGDRHYPTMLEMAKGDQALTEKLMFGRDYRKNYRQLMEILKENAQAMGYDPVSFALNEIPGYQDDVTYIKDPVEAEGVISVIKNQDYQDLQADRDNIVARDQAGIHWVYRQCILYHEASGVCVQGLLDYYDTVEVKPEYFPGS